MKQLKRFTLVTYLFYIVAFVLIAYTVLDKYILVDNQQTKVETVTAPKPNEFGFISNHLIKDDLSVNTNETFSDILLNYNIGYPTIDFLVKNYDKVFDFRKIISGNRYHVYMTQDSIPKLDYLVYEKNPIDFVVVDLKDSGKVYDGSKKVEIKNRTVEGTINNSLYQTMVDNEVDPELVIKLSEIYAWEIDFYRIQKGDSFKVIFEEEYVDGKPIGIGNIVGAYFNHRGEPYYAINFDQDGKNEFFDENGKSLRKAFLKAPVKFSRISSRYSLRRYHPIEHRVKAHLGTDYAAPTGTPILSTGDGVVIAATYSTFNGNYVKIRHNSVYSTQYLHMSHIAKGIHNGVRVKQGQVIGYVGMTGEATGPHVCYRFWKNGMQVDPFRQKIPSVHPVDPKYLPEFDKVKNTIIAELDTINSNKEDDIKVAAGVASPKP
jgi:murein DD-endopeptidase MepM/ murein hydrolase activator NlpD